MTTVRAAYAERASEYTALLGSMSAVHPADRELVLGWAAGIHGRVLDAGCGPGHWTHLLQSHGVDTTGVDQVPEFIDRATERFPTVPFRVGRLEALDEADGSLGGILAWYSIIHTPPKDLGPVLGEFARCLAPGGSLLLGFFDGPRVEAFEHAVITAYRWPVDALASELASAGFEVAQTHTRADPGERPHAAILARLHPTREP